METAEHFLGDRIERGEHVLPSGGDGFEGGKADASSCAIIEIALEFGSGGGSGGIAFIVLKRDRKASGIGSVIPHVLNHRVERMVIGFEAIGRGIRYEDEAIRTVKNELASGIVMNLAGDGVELKTSLVTINFRGVHGQEIEEQCAIGRGRKGNEVSTLLLVHFGVDVRKICRLPA